MTLSDKVDFEFPQQDLFSAQMSLAPSGSPLDWTAGYSMDGELRADPSDAVAAANFSFSYDTPMVPSGLVTITLATTGVPVGTYSYSLRLKGPGGYIKTVAFGSFKILPSPTQS